MTDFIHLSKSIGSELAIIHEADTKLNDIIFVNAENPGESLDYWLKIIDTSKTKISKMMRKVNSLVKNGWLSDYMYHAEVTKLYGVINQHEFLWLYTDSPPQFISFYHLYNNYYIQNVIKPYNKSLILEAIYAIKDNTPIVDDNICDILSFLNDEKYFTKHQVDNEIYDIV